MGHSSFNRLRLSISLVLVAIIVASSIGACTVYNRLNADALHLEGTPFSLSGPFRSYWEANDGAASLGVPRSDAIWRNGERVQYFDSVLLESDRWGKISLHPLSDDWQQVLPSQIVSLPASKYQATITTSITTTQPLETVPLSITVDSFEGPIEVQLFDIDGRALGSWTGEVNASKGTIDVLAGGSLGQQQALILIDGQVAAFEPELYLLDAQTSFVSDYEHFNKLYELTRDFVARSSLTYGLDGQQVHGYRSPDSNLLWLRDHAYQARMARYFDSDIRSLIDAFRRSQQPDGSFPDYLERPQLHLPAQRMTVEADVEYLFVQAVYEAWKATGDDAWLIENLPAMRAALNYSMSDPERWDAEKGLVKRPYTIDTWDFEYGPTTRSPDDGQPAPRHWIEADSRWGIFHGDNTGLAFALYLLADAEERVGDGTNAARALRAQSREIMKNLNDLSWNGRFFTHNVLYEPFEIEGIDTAEQLSLSNSLALNRTYTLEDHQARAIIGEYYQRYLDRGDNFAEWYSIDPPFPSGHFGLAGRKGENPGEYVNGGILPLVGGELARGTFDYGMENYGFDILTRYTNLISPTETTYLWYYPLGNPGVSGPDTLAHDGWGASAMLEALIEGAGGVEDTESRFEEVELSPRWTAVDKISDLRLTTRYAASDGYVAYHWKRNETGITIFYTGSGSEWEFRVLMPSKQPPSSVTVNGEAVEFEIDKSRGSRSVAFEGDATMAVIEIVW
jgi:hypothetical protein